jgi:hypothetical protein
MSNERKPRKKHYVEFEAGLVTFDTAKLAKEKECKIEGTVLVYDAQGDLTLDIGVNNEDIGMNNESYDAPTQSLVQKWLREVHNIQIEIRCKQKKRDVFEYQYAGFIYSELVEEPFEDKDCEFNTYELALEDALIASLNLIKI